MGKLHPGPLGPRERGDRDSNRRPLAVAALRAVLAYQIEGVGTDGDGTYLDVKLGLARPVRVHLLGLTAVELEELS